jgi:hypothetical protein
MIFGRGKEVQKLVQNLSQGIHTLAFGVPGAGKTAILLEASSRLSTDCMHVVYVNNCSSRRNLLESALASVRENNLRKQGIPVKELRDELLRTCEKQRLCLVLDHVPTKLHHRMQRLFEMFETCCTMAFGVTASASSYDLYYWKFDVLQVGNLQKKPSLAWINAQLSSMNYAGPLKKAIALELIRLTAGNPGAISRTIATIGKQAMPIDDPVRVRRMFIDGKIR